MGLSIQELVRQAEQVVLALNEQEFFTHDQLIQIDGILHQGKYLFTSGPTETVNLLDGSPLLSFGDHAVDSKNALTVEIEALEPLDKEESSSEDSAIQAQTATSPPSSNTSEQTGTPHSEIHAQRDENTFSWANSVVEPAPLAVPAWQWADPKPSRVSSTSDHVRPASSVSNRVSNYDRPMNDSELQTNSIVTVVEPCARTSFIILEAEVGDQIKIMKHVSGVMYFARNMRTNLTGQIARDRVVESYHVMQDSTWEQPKVTAPTKIHQLDDMETSAAAEWNDLDATDAWVAPSATQVDTSQQWRESPRVVEIPQSLITLTPESLDALIEKKLSNMMAKTQPQQSHQPQPAPKEKGLQASRYSAHPPSQNGPKSGTYKIPQRKTCSAWATPGGCDDKTCRDNHFYNTDDSVKAAQPASVTGGSGRSASGATAAASSQDHLQKQYCWYFITPGKECRFTSEECKALHEMPEDDFQPSALPKMPMVSAGGDPTWTCWYWATAGRTCTNDEGHCKYAHVWTGRIAHNPTTNRWKQAAHQWQPAHQSPDPSASAAGQRPPGTSLTWRAEVASPASAKASATASATANSWMDSAAQEPSWTSGLNEGVGEMSTPMWQPVQEMADEPQFW